MTATTIINEQDALVTKTTSTGKTAQVFYGSYRFEVLLDGVSGGLNAGPQVITDRATGKKTLAIAWGAKFISLTEAEVQSLGGINTTFTGDASTVPCKPAVKIYNPSRCRVCGCKVNYNERYAEAGYCGCEGE